jgi:hypothetical protein
LKNTFTDCEGIIDLAIQILENELQTPYGFSKTIPFSEMQVSEALWRALCDTVLQDQGIRQKVIEAVWEILMEKSGLFADIMDLETHPEAMNFMIGHVLKVAVEVDR